MLLALVAMADHLGAFGYRGDDWANFDRAEAKVVRVIDGVTVEVLANNRSTPVHLLGLLPAKDFGYLESHLPGRTVRLKLETLAPRDSAGRLDAYLYSGDDNLNLELISTGHARVDRKRDHSMRSMYELAESQARKAKRGLWAE